jgi:hypothetical protein
VEVKCGGAIDRTERTGDYLQNELVREVSHLVRRDDDVEGSLAWE